MNNFEIVYINTKDLGIYKYNTNVVTGMKLVALSESIKKEGIIEPLLVAPVTEKMARKLLYTRDQDAKYVIIDGNHRAAIANILKIPTLPCIVVAAKNIDDVMKISIGVNNFRGEQSTDKLGAMITERLGAGIPIKELCDDLCMREHWILQYVQWHKEIKRGSVYYKNLDLAHEVMLPLPVSQEDFNFLVSHGLIGEHDDFLQLSRKMSVLVKKLIKLKETGKFIKHITVAEREELKSNFMTREYVIEFLDRHLYDLQSKATSEAAKNIIVKKRNKIRELDWWKTKTQTIRT